MGIKRFASIMNPYSNAVFTADQKQTSVNVARNLRLHGVRYDMLAEVFAATRGGAYNFTYLDQVTDMVVTAGLECSLVIAFVPTGGGWVSSTKLVSAADIPYLCDAYVAAVNRVISRGQPRSKIRIEMWNEPDLVAFGAPSAGVIHRGNIAFFNACASAMKTNFPDITLSSPSIGYYDTVRMTWDSITNSNCGVNGVVDSHWQYYDEFNVHYYLSVDSVRPAKTLADMRRIANYTFNNLEATINATSLISGYFSTKPIVVSECGMNFVNAGMSQQANNWGWGNETMRAKYLMRVLNTLAARSRISMVSIYRTTNSQASYDARDDAQHYGICDSNGNSYILYTELGLLSGQSGLTMGTGTATEGGGSGSSGDLDVPL